MCLTCAAWAPPTPPPPGPRRETPAFATATTVKVAARAATLDKVAFLSYLQNVSMPGPLNICNR